jgi:DNA-binding NtrC family response regulator
MVRDPPLRDRLSDVPELAALMLRATCDRFGIRPKQLSPDALSQLMAYDWHENNVRELRNVIERMVIASDGNVIGPEHVPAEIRDAGTPRPHSPEARTFVERRAEAERAIVIAALERNAWHITRTAAELGLADHASLIKIMRRLGVESR